MEWIVGGMLLIFFLIGLGLLGQTFVSLGRVLARRSFLIQTTGQIVRVDRQRLIRSRGMKRSGSHRAQTANYPVIEYRTQLGELRTFRSETGDISEDDFLAGPDAESRSKYKAGQPIAIWYDPANHIPPVIESFRTIWFSSAMLALAGMVFLGAGLVILVTFGERIVAALPLR